MWSPAPAFHREQHTGLGLRALQKFHKCFASVKLQSASPLWFGVIPKPVPLAPAHCFRFLPSASPFLLSQTPCWLPTLTYLYSFRCEDCWVMSISPGRFPQQCFWVFNEEASCLLTVIMTYPRRSADPVTQMNSQYCYNIVISISGFSCLLQILT